MERPADSRSQPSLDEIVSRSAAAIADQIRRAAALAKSEMDLQIDVAGALKKFAVDAKITLEGHNNITDRHGPPGFRLWQRHRRIQSAWHTLTEQRRGS